MPIDPSRLKRPPRPSVAWPEERLPRSLRTARAARAKGIEAEPVALPSTPAGRTEIAHHVRSWVLCGRPAHCADAMGTWRGPVVAGTMALESCSMSLTPLPERPQKEEANSPADDAATMR